MCPRMHWWRWKYIFVQVYLKWPFMSKKCCLTSVGHHALMAEPSVPLPICPVSNGGRGERLPACLALALAVPARDSLFLQKWLHKLGWGCERERQWKSEDPSLQGDRRVGARLITTCLSESVHPTWQLFACKVLFSRWYLCCTKSNFKPRWLLVSFREVRNSWILDLTFVLAQKSCKDAGWSLLRRGM